jgi:type II secretory pathway pseudopilin PulG
MAGKLKVFKDEKGLTLVESLITIAIVGGVLGAFIVALSTGSLAVRENDQELTTQSLARSQMEYTKGYPFNPGATTYPAVAAPADYSVTVGVSTVLGADDPNVQKITANVSRDGQVLLTVEDYKVKR